MKRAAGADVIRRARARNVVALSLAACAALAAASLAVTREADAQRIDPRRPAVFVVGAPAGPSPTLRGDSRRSGVTMDLLPSGVLHVAWRKTIGLSIEQPVLAGEGGNLAVVTATRGEVIFLDEDGEEKGRATAGSGSVGPATMTSDGTVVFTTSIGEAVGMRRASARPRFVTRIGGERNVRAAPLSLDDGGVVLATAQDLVVIDAEGNVRARVSLPESPAAPLLATADKVLAVTTSGAVYGWTPGREPVRLGSFGAPIDGGAALADPGTLVAVIEGNHLVDLDLARGGLTSRSIATQGLYLGPPSLRPAGGGGTATGGAGSTLATLLGITPTRALVVTIDPGGLEVAHAPIATLTPPVSADGGPGVLVAPAHTGPLVDVRGAVAFAAPDGHVGMVGVDGSVDTLGELICSRTARSSGIAGLTAAGPGAFVVTCESGAVAKITGAGGGSLRGPGPKAPDGTPNGTGRGSTRRPATSAGPKPDEDDDER